MHTILSNEFCVTLTLTFDKNGNSVKAMFHIVACCFDSVASTLLLV